MQIHPKSATIHFALTPSLMCWKSKIDIKKIKYIISEYFI